MRLTYQLFVSMVLLVCSALAAVETGPSLRVLLICDAQPSKLAYAYRFDLDRMKRNVEGIAFQSNLTLDLQIFDNEQVGAKTIKSWLATLPKSSNDTVLVYYVGRQARHAATKGKWPSVMPAGRQKSISAMEIAKLLKQRNPRLSLVFFDCYDRKREVPCRDRGFSRCIIPVDEDYSTIKPLFTIAKGLFVTCSGSKGSKNFCITQEGKFIGGAFTTALMESIEENTAGSSWAKGCISLERLYGGLSKRCKHLVYRRVEEPRYSHIWGHSGTHRGIDRGAK